MWFKKKNIEKKEKSIRELKERQIQDTLLGFALEAYQNKNFSVAFKSDYDRKYMEFIPNLVDIGRYHDKDNTNHEQIILKHLENGPLVIIHKNQSISWDWGNGAYKTGGLNFKIYTRNDEGYILVYSYNNVSYGINYSNTVNKFTLYNRIYDGSYYDKQYEVDYAFDKRWNDKNIEVEIHRMKNLEKIVGLMVDEQTIDQEARNLDRMDKLLGVIPKQSKRDRILKELLNEK